MDLKPFMEQLKVAIKKHQHVVSIINKQDERSQNPAYQKQLKEAQEEIIALNEKQKLILAKLRLERETAQIPVPAQVSPPVLSPNRGNRQVTLMPPLNHMLVPTPPSKVMGPPNGNENPCQPVLVVPSPPDNRLATSVVLSLVPPIRVPRYPAVKSEIINNNNNNNNTTNGPISSDKKAITSKFSPKTKESTKKIEFMRALHLLTRESFEEYQNKPVERKRRSTANPQFSSAALEERKRTAALLSQENGNNSAKRPRGRPRLVSTPNNSRPVSPDLSQTVLVNGLPLKIELPPSNLTSKTILKQIEACKLCGTGGDMLKCFVCSSFYHISCLEAPYSLIKPVAPSLWKCPKCCPQITKLLESSWPEDLQAIRVDKEEEKQTLLRRSLELKSERSRLEDKAKHFREVINEQKQKKADLQTTYQQLQANISQFQEVIQRLQTPS